MTVKQWPMTILIAMLENVDAYSHGLHTSNTNISLECLTRARRRTSANSGDFVIIRHVLQLQHCIQSHYTFYSKPYFQKTIRFYY